jgi:hypothetical protein
MRILFCTGNQGKFEEAVHAFDHLSGGGVSAGRVTVRRRAAAAACAPLSAPAARR